MSTFEQELEEPINRHSIENQSDTPDFILAGYIIRCLQAWNDTVAERDRWYGFKPFAPSSDPALRDITESQESPSTDGDDVQRSTNEPI